MTTALSKGLIATSVALAALGLSGCASGATTTAGSPPPQQSAAPTAETAEPAPDVPDTTSADALQSFVDTVRPEAEAEAARYSDLYSDFSLEAEGSGTMVYSYTYMSQVDAEQARSSIESARGALEGFAELALPEMKSWGVSEPSVKWVYHNADGTVITTIDVAG